MEEILTELAKKWFSSLDFTLSRKGENYTFVCEKLNIKINSISQEEFFATVTNEILLKIENFLKSFGFGQETKQETKKEEPKPEKTEMKPEKPSAKQEINEDWIREELKKAFRNGEMNRKRSTIDDLYRDWQRQRQDFPDYRLDFKDVPKFPWNQVICFVE